MKIEELASYLTDENKLIKKSSESDINILQVRSRGGNSDYFYQFPNEFVLLHVMVGGAKISFKKECLSLK